MPHKTESPQNSESEQVFEQIVIFPFIETLVRDGSDKKSVP